MGIWTKGTLHFVRCREVMSFAHLQFLLELLYYSKGRTQERLPMPLRTLQHLRKTDREFRNEEGSAFETPASAFCSLVDDMERRLASEVMAKAKAACRKYQAERYVHRHLISRPSY